MEALLFSCHYESPAVRLFWKSQMREGWEIWDELCSRREGLYDLGLHEEAGGTRVSATQRVHPEEWQGTDSLNLLQWSPFTCGTCRLLVWYYNIIIMNRVWPSQGKSINWREHRHQTGEGNLLWSQSDPLLSGDDEVCLDHEWENDPWAYHCYLPLPSAFLKIREVSPDSSYKLI